MIAGFAEWKDQVTERIRAFAADPQKAWQTAKSAGVQTLTGYLMGMSLFPLVEALSGASTSGDMALVMALGNLAAQAGINLISNRLSGADSEERVAQVVVEKKLGFHDPVCEDERCLGCLARRALQVE